VGLKIEGIIRAHAGRPVIIHLHLVDKLISSYLLSTPKLKQLHEVQPKLRLGPMDESTLGGELLGCRVGIARRVVSERVRRVRDENTVGKKTVRH
jgi:hypothetical protein